MMRRTSTAIQQDGEREGSRDEPPRKKKKFFHWPQMLMRWNSAENEVPVKIVTLPDEPVLSILSYLSFQELTGVAQNVCSQWRRVSHDPALWQNKEYCIDASKSDTEAVTFLHQWPEVGNVVMNRSVQPPVIEALCNCSHLKTLQFYYSQIVEYSLLKKLLDSCRNIQELAISHQQLDSESKGEILSQLQRLQSLHIEICPQCKEPIHLRQVADGCPQLSKLQLSSMVEFSTEDLEYFINVKRNTLTHLELPWAGKNGRCVVPLLNCCTSLTYLELFGADYNFQDVIVDVTTLGDLSTLHSLKLMSCYQCLIESFELAFRSRGLKHLQVLEVSDGPLHDEVVEHICIGCPELKELLLKSCYLLTDEALRPLPHLSNLEVFGLSRCEGMHGAALSYITQLPKLRKLSLEWWDLRTLDPGLECVLDISTLETLSFAFCRNASTFPFDRIPVKLVKLSYLNVAACDLNKKLLKQLKKQMPGLVVYAPTINELFPFFFERNNNGIMNKVIYLGVGMIGMVTSTLVSNLISGII